MIIDSDTYSNFKLKIFLNSPSYLNKEDVSTDVLQVWELLLEQCEEGEAKKMLEE